MKRTILTSLVLSLLACTSCMKQTEAPEYSFVSLELENGSSDEKLPRINFSSIIDAGVFCIHAQLNLEPKVVTDYGFDTRKPMTNKTPIDSIFITSNIDFNSSILAGDNLNSFFRIYRGDYYSLKKLADFEPTDITETAYYKNGPFRFVRYLLLAEKPTILGPRKFYLQMKSGTKIFSDSVEVNLF